MTNAIVKFPTAYRPDVKFDIADGYQFYGHMQQGNSGHFCMGINGPGGCLWREIVDLKTGDTPTLIRLHKYVFAEVWRSHRRWWHHLMFWRRP